MALTKSDIQQAMQEHPAISNALEYWYDKVLPRGLDKHNWNRTKQQTHMADLVQDMRTPDMLIAVTFIKYILAEVEVQLEAHDAKFLRGVENNIHTDSYFELEYSGKDSRKQNPVHQSKWRTLMLLIDITSLYMNYTPAKQGASA